MITKLKTLKEHQGFMKYFKNTSWLFGEKILRMIVGLFVGIWVARYLGFEQFGLFSYAQAFVGLFAVFATLGLDGIVVRELVKGENDTSTLIGTVFYLKIIGARMFDSAIRWSNEKYSIISTQSGDINLYLGVLNGDRLYEKVYFHHLT